jgi:uncharacterized protein
MRTSDSGISSTAFGLAFGLALTAVALTAGPASAVTTNIPPAGLPSASEYGTQLLPERAGVVSWRTLAKVEPVKKDGRMVPSFAADILSLDRKDVRVQGFMIPLDIGDKQKRFLIAAVPPHCSFCLPAGPDAVVEINARAPVRYSLEPIVVSGKFEVLKDDPAGMLYRMTDAEMIGVAIPAAPSKGGPTAKGAAAGVQ